MKSSTKDKAGGKRNHVKDKLKMTVEKPVGNQDLEAGGKGENLKGKAQRRLGENGNERYGLRGPSLDQDIYETIVVRRT